MKIGYARVSTRDQDPQLQLDALKAAGVEDIRIEHASGKDRSRPVLEQTLAELGEGDVLVVWKLDRLGRSVVDLENIISKELAAKGIGFVSITDGIDTSTNGGQLTLSTEMLVGMLAVMARFERGLIRERVTNGVAAAKRNGTRSGKAIGRPRKLTDDDLDLLVELWDHGTPVASLAKKWDVDQATIYRAYKRAKARQT